MGRRKNPKRALKIKKPEMDLNKTPEKKKRSELTPLTPKIILTPIILNRSINVTPNKNCGLYSIPLDATDNVSPLRSSSKCRRSLLSLLENADDQDKYRDSDDDKDDPYLSSGSEYLSESSISSSSDQFSDNDDEHCSNMDKIAYDNLETEQTKSTWISDNSISSENHDTSSILINTKTKRGKKQACLFCKQLVVQLPKHLKRKHQDQPIIQKLLGIQCNKEKQNILARLRKEGNFINNSRVLETGVGQMVVKRRPERKSKVASDFLPCSNCLAFYDRKSLFRHMKLCDVKKSKWSRIQASSASLLPTNKYASKILKERVLSIMHQDEITLVVKNDCLILKFGSNLCEKFSGEDEKHLNVYVSQKMRELGRLLLAVKQVNLGKQLKLSELIDPKYFDLIIDSTKVVACYDAETGLYKNPSLARKIGFSLIQCSSILKASSIRSDNEVVRKLCDDFTLLLRNEWNIKIGRHAKNTLEKARYNKPTLLPIAEDLKILHEYVVANEAKLLELLLIKYSYDKWAEFCEIILVRLILFNRRRAGEINRLSINNFNNRSSSRESTDVFQSLSETEKKLTRQFCYVELRGKRGRKVPLLMPNNTEANIVLLIKLREKAGVPKTNPYVFGKLNDTSHFDGCTAFRKIVQKCNLKHPDRLRSTNLRKHIATMSQVMSLRENEIESLASFMGHDPKIHKEYYKLPESAIYLAKVSKLLVAMESGNIETYKGKNFDTIGIEIEEEEDPVYDLNDEDTSQKSNTDVNVTKQKNEKITNKRVHWSDSEIAAMKRHLSHFLHASEVPGKEDCEACIKKEPALKFRSWKNVKYWIYNQTKKKLQIKNVMPDNK